MRLQKLHIHSSFLSTGKLGLPLAYWQWKVAHWLFLCSNSRIFHSYGDVTITGEGHSWPLSSEGSIAWHTYCDTRRSSPRTRDTLTFCQAFGSGAVTTWFLRLRSVAIGIRTPNLPTYNNFVLLWFHSSSWVGKTNSPEFDIFSNSSFPCVIFRLSQWNCCNHWGCWGVA